MGNKVFAGLASLIVPMGLYAPAVQSYGTYQRNGLNRQVKSLPVCDYQNRIAADVLSEDNSMVQAIEQLSIVQGQPTRELVIIDEAVPDKQMYYQQARPGIEFQVIESNHDGLVQLEQALSHYRDLDALHLVSHAEDGKLYLGNSSIDTERFNQSLNTITSLDKALKNGADILMYGCELASGEQGEALLELVSLGANVDVAASDDLTGSSDLGGDWDLEIKKGDVTIPLMFDSVAMRNYRAVLGYSGTLALGNMPTGYAASKSYQIPTTTYTIQFTSNTNASKDFYNYSAGYLYVSTNDSSQIKSYVSFTNNETFDLTSIYVYQGFGAPTKTIRFTSSKGGVQDTASTVAASSGTTVNFSGANWQGITQFDIHYSDDTTMHWVKIDNIVMANIASAGPTISGATYDYSTGNLVVTGTNFDAKSGGANDITVSNLTITGEGSGGSAYTLTSSNVERDSATQFSVSLNAADKLIVSGLLNKDSTTADDGTTYNLAAADDFVAQITAGNTAIATSAITVSNYANPTITSSTYDFSAGTLVVTGTNFAAVSGANNDIDVTKLTLTGDSGDTYTLTSSNVDVTNNTTFSVNLNATDLVNVNGLLNKNGFNAASGQAYNLAAADNWALAGASSVNIADAAATVNVSNVTAPAIASASYDHASGILAVTGTNFVAKSGANNDIDVTKLALVSDTNFNLTTSNVDVTSSTSFSVTLNAADQLVAVGLLDKNGTSADDGSVYNLEAADNWSLASDSATNIEDLTGNGINVSNVVVPTITSATYDYTTGVLTVTGVGLGINIGSNNDLDPTTLTLTGEGGGTYTLTGSSFDFSSATTFSITLSGVEKMTVNGLLNKDGTTADNGTAYNIAAADNWLGAAAPSVDIADLTSNIITVSNYAAPTVTSATYNVSTGSLQISGTGFVKLAGSNNDVDVTKLNILGEASNSHNLTSSNFDIGGETLMTVALNAADQLAAAGLFNKDGTTADDGTTYNLSALDNWMAGGPSSVDIADSTSPVTVSNVAVPAITSATYDVSTGILLVTGTDFAALAGGANDIVVPNLSITGDAGGSRTLTGIDVDLISNTSFSVTLNAADRLAVNGLLNKNGTQSGDSTNYNLAAAENWNAGAAANATIADLTGNAITVSNVAAPAVTSTAYNAGTGVLTVTGTNFVGKTGASDVTATTVTLTGEGGNSYTLTADTADVEITSATEFSLTLGSVDKLVVNGLLNKNGTQADDGATNYNAAFADNYLTAVDNATDIADANNSVNVSNVQVPALTSATYNATSKVLVVTGSGFARAFGANDVDVTKLSLVGYGSGEYVLTSSDVELTSETEFSVTLSDTDKINVNGLLNKDGTQAGDSTAYNVKAAEDWLRGAATNATIVDAGVNTVTVSGTVSPAISSATYDYSTGVLAVTGTRLVKQPGASNDIDITKLTVLGLGSGTRVLTTTNVEISNETSFSVTLNSADKTLVNSLLDNNGTQASDNVVYNLNAAEDWATGADVGANIVDATGNGITVSNVPVPTITSANYNYTTGVLSVTGADFEAKSGAANDVTANLFTLTGEAGASYTLTDTPNVEIINATSFSLTLSSTDKLNVNALLNKNGTQADDNSVYNLAVADNFIANVTAGNTADTTGNPVTVASVVSPTVSSATYDFSTGILAVTGTGFVSKAGALNDVDVTKLSLFGDGSVSYTLTSASVEVSDETSFSVTLNAADRLNVHGILNKDGLSSGQGQTYNLAAVEDWLAGAATSSNIADLTANGVTVSNVVGASITSASYNVSTGVLAVTGSHFVYLSGASNDVVVSNLALVGEGGGSYTLTSNNVEIANGTSFSVTLNATDQLFVNALLNKNGLQADDNTTYNLAASDNWMAASLTGGNIADLTLNGVTVSNVTVPTLTSATYNYATGALVVTGTGFVSVSGSNNDIDVTKLNIRGEASNSHNLTSTNVDVTSNSQFTVNLTAADQLVASGLFNKNGTQADDNTVYNLQGLDNWLLGAATSVDIADLTSSVTVSNVAVPTITSATYDASTGILAVTGADLPALPGGANDIVVPKFTITGEGGSTRTLTGIDVELTSNTAYSITLNAADKLAVNGLLNKNGTLSADSTSYNLAAAEDWAAGAAANATIADLTGNAITVSNVAPPTITSATFDAGTGVLVVTATDLVALAGANNDIDVTKLAIIGSNSGNYNLTSTNVEITSATSFSVTLNANDQIYVGGLLNKNGTSADDGMSYNLAASDNWAAGFDSATDIADLTGNAITVSNISNPTITAASYDYATGVLVFTGTDLVAQLGSNNDVVPSSLTLSGEGGTSYTLTTAGVDITSSTSFSITLTGTEKMTVNGLLNQDGIQANSGAAYNVAASDNWLAAAAASVDIKDLTNNAITVSNYALPTISSATYDATSGLLTISGTGFVKLLGTDNDLDPTKLNIRGEASNSYNLTASAKDIGSETLMSVTLTAADKLAATGIFNKNGASADDGTVYNLAALDNWLAGAAPTVDSADSTATVTVSNVAVPAITSASYDATTGVLTVTGSDFAALPGGANDIVVPNLTISGEAGGTRTLTGIDVDLTSNTSFAVTLNAADKLAVNSLLNKNGTASSDSTTYNLAAAENWNAGAATNAIIADLTGNGITVTNVLAPTITAASYDHATGILAVTGANFVSKSGANNDIDVTKLALIADTNFNLTSGNVDITDASSFSVTLNAFDQQVAVGLLNKNGTSADDGSTYNLQAADNWMLAADSATDIADLTGNPITVSNVVVPSITAASYDYTAGILTVTGSGLGIKIGSNNDLDPTTLTITGEGGATYTLTGSAFDFASSTTFSMTLTGTEKMTVNGLLNKDGNTADSGTSYNLAAADNWLGAAATSVDIADLTANPITVSNYTAPSITAATYDAATGNLQISGANFVKQIGADNDIDVTKLNILGEALNSHNLTGTGVDLGSETLISVTLNAADKLVATGLFNKDGTSSDDGSTYNLNALDNWLAAGPPSADISDSTSPVTVSNVAIPTITSATYDASTGVLLVTGADLAALPGGANDIVVPRLTLTGEAGGSFTLTGIDVDLISNTSFSLTLTAADKLAVNGLLNKNGTNAADSTAYNLAAADNWASGAAASVDIADLTGNAVTVSNVAIPTITAANYNALTGQMVVTGSDFVSKPGANNDVDISLLTVTGENAATYTLTSATDVDVSSNTSFSFTLTGSDKTNVDGLLNKDGVVSDASSTSYNLAAADNWMTASDSATDISDLTANVITVSNVSVPTVASATYDMSTGVMTVTANNLANFAGANNDIDLSLLTITGQNGANYTLSTTTDVDITSSSGFSFTLSGEDKLNVDGLLNKAGNSAGSGASYNLAAAEDWARGAATSATIADLVGNNISVSNLTTPSISAANYNFASGLLTITGSQLRRLFGNNNDVDVTKLSLTGEAGDSYNLTSSNVEVSSDTNFSVNVSEVDRININGLLNKNGTNADDATLYNLAAADDWLPAVLSTTNIAIGSVGLTVAGVVMPSITSISYDATTGVVTVTGLNFVKKFGANNDVDISLLTFTGEGGATYTLTAAVDVEIISSTSFSFTLSGADLAGVNNLLNANGTSSVGGTAYNLAAADNWLAGSASSANIADVSANAITVTNVPTPTIVSATYNATTATLVVTGTNFAANSGAANDVSVSKLTLTGEAGGSYSLTSNDVEIDSANQFTVVLNSVDKINVNGLLNLDGTLSSDGNGYNLAAADDFIAAITAADSSDASNSVTVSAVVAPTLTTASYNYSSQLLTVTGTGFSAKAGSNNDVDLSLLTLTGEGGVSYSLTTATDVDISSETSFSTTLIATDALAVNGLLNTNGLSADDGTSYNLAVADNYMTAVAVGLDTTDSTNVVTVSNVTLPTVTGVIYDAAANTFSVTGSGFAHFTGFVNDVDISAFTITGHNGVSYTITSGADTEVDSATSFSFGTSGGDLMQIEGLLNLNGTTAESGTTYNVALADNWMRAIASSSDSSIATIPLTAVNVVAPTITSATYDVSSGFMSVTGTELRYLFGLSNDLDFSKWTITGEGGATYTLTSPSVDIRTSTLIELTVNSADKTALEAILNRDGILAGDNTVYNLAAAEDWLLGAATSLTIADLTGNGITVSNAVTPTVSMSASSNSISENAGSTSITATLTSIAAADVVVNVSYSGSASLGTDYTTTAATSITIPQGQTSATITLTALQDTDVEASETIVVALTAATNAHVSSTNFQQTINVVDDDSTDVTLTASSGTIAESGGTSTITATLSQATFEAVTVNLGFSGTASNGTDYNVSTSAITIAAGQTTGTAVITAANDTAAEGNETIVVDISSVSGGSAAESGSQQQTISIIDDDNVTVTLASSATAIAENGGSSTITASLNQPTFETVTVNLALSGTAGNGTDYNISTSAITIAAGQTTGSAVITAANDTVAEGDETIVIDISSVSGGSAVESGVQQQTITVTDDESVAVTLTASATAIAENGGSSTITASLNQPTFAVVTVNLGFTGTAGNSVDYAASSTSISIPVGQTTGTISVTAADDSSVEGSETIVIDIVSVTGGNAVESGSQQQTISITDDDAISVSLAATPTSASENGGSYTVTANLTAITFETVTINLAFAGSAAFGTDYSVSSSVISIASGQTSGTMTISNINDADDETDETIEVSIASVTGGSAFENGSQLQTLTITDDDDTTPPAGFAMAPPAASANNASVTVTGAEVGSTYNATASDGKSVIGSSAKMPSFTRASINFSGVITSSTQTIDNLDISPLADGPITFTLTLTDLAGNVSEPVSVSFTKDTLSPTVELQSASTAPNAQSVSVTAVFSEVVTDLALADFSVSNGTVSELTGEGANYNFTLTPIIAGEVVLSLPAGVSFDEAGNGNQASNELNVTFDAQAPQITQLSPLNNAEGVAINSAFTIIFDEDVKLGSGAMNIHLLSDGSAVQQLTVSEISQTKVELSVAEPLANGVGYFITIAQGAFTDSVGNEFAGIADNSAWRFTTVAASAPITFADSALTDEDNAVAIDVLANDSSGSAELNPASVTVVNNPNNGSVSVNTANGVITYTPSVNFNGNDGFTYVVSDLTGITSSETQVSVTVNAVNDAPVAVNDVVTTEQDIAVIANILNNDSDIDSAIDSNSLVIVSVPSNGVASIDNGTIRYLPNSGFVGSDSLSYQVADDAGLSSNVATLMINVVGSNVPPIAQNDVITIDEDSSAAIAVLTNDSDNDGQLDTRSVSLVTQPKLGVATVTSVGQINYVANANVSGVDEFNYTVKDNEGALSNSAKITVTINAVNDAPVAVDDAVVLLEDASHLINVLGNDSDVDSQMTAVVIVNSPQNGAASVTDALQITYTPNANFTGSDSLSYQVRDQQGTLSNVANVSISVTAVNDGPIANNDVVQTDEDQAIDIAVLANDSDVDGQLDQSSLSVSVAPIHGSTVINAGVIRYTPQANYFGEDSFSYQITDDQGAMALAVVSITINSVNDAPVAQAQNISVNEDGSIAIELTGSDADGDALTFAVGQPTNGSLTGSESSWVYQPNADFNGEDSFDYSVSDGQVSSATVSVTISVTAQNDGPQVSDVSVSTLEDSSLNITLSATDKDGDALSYQVVSSSSNGVLTGDAPNLIYVPNANFFGSDSFSYRVNDGAVDSELAVVSIDVIAVNDTPVASDLQVTLQEDNSSNITVQASDIDGDALSYQFISVTSNGQLTGQLPNVTYTPADNFSGSDSFSFVANDGSSSSNVATVTITVEPSNDAPQALDMQVATNEDTALNISVQGSDIDGDALGFQLVSTVTNGQLTGQLPNVIYTPSDNFSGSDSFSFTVSDGQLTSNLATVTINVNPINDAPVAESLALTTVEDNNLEIVVLASDIDGDSLSYQLVTGPSNGQLNGELPNVTYVPTENFVGNDSFSFTVNDGNLDSNVANVTIEITAGNDAPVANVLSLTLDEDSSRSFTLTGSDIDGDALSFVIESGPSNGVISGQGANLIYTPDGDFNGSDSFSFVAFDGSVNSAAVTVPITVNAVNDAPEAVNDSFSRDNWLAFDLNVLANDIDIDGDSLEIIGATTDIGTLSFTANSIRYTPIEGFIGDVLVSYQIRDSAGADASAIAQISINVLESDLPVITPPVDVEVNATGLTTRVDLGVATAVDRNGNSIAVALDDPTNFFRPGLHTVTWRATDGEGRQAVASQLVRVNPLVTVDLRQTVLEGFAVTVPVYLNGDAPSYPLVVPFSVGGSAEVGVDHDLSVTTMTIESGTEGHIRFNVFSDDVFEGEETIEITLLDDGSVNRGGVFVHTITINEQNVNPQVELQVEQAGEQRFEINQQDGNVTVTANVTHPDIFNIYQFEWSNQQQVLVDLDDIDHTFTFDPSGIDVGVYRVEVTVIDIDDSDYRTTAQATLNLQAAATELGEGDSDADGVPDNVEGLGDEDTDGIPDYLDNIDACNVLPEEVDATEAFLVESESGICMRLGDIALLGDTGGVRIISTPTGDSDAANTGGMFDFILYNLPEIGAIYRVVMPQTQPIPVNAIYRKLTLEQQWRDYVEVDGEQLLSSAGEPGHCPPPTDESWQPGLIEGFWCVQLLIRDGGPNDADGIANGVIVDPGGVGVLVNNNQLPVATDDIAQTRVNFSVTIDVVANDSDADGDSLVITSATPVFGQAVIEQNQIVYQPAIDFVGEDTVIYSISDGQGGVSSATLTIAVLANNNPLAVEDSAEVVVGETVEIDVLANDSDIDNDSIRLLSASALNGSVEVTADQTLMYTADQEFVGVDTIEYQIADALGAESTGVVMVTVNAKEPPEPIHDGPIVKINQSSGGASVWLLLLLVYALLFRAKLAFDRTAQSRAKMNYK